MKKRKVRLNLIEMTKNKKTLFIIVVLISFGILSCSEKKKKNTEFLNDQKFKTWLYDTLKILSKNQIITISSDSSSLMIKKKYVLKSNDLTYSDKIPSFVISTLSELGELPLRNFQVSFIHKKFFYPSPIPKIERECVEEIENLTVKTKDDWLFKYTFIRGRISNRKKYFGDSILEEVDF